MTGPRFVGSTLVLAGAAACGTFESATDTTAPSNTGGAAGCAAITLADDFERAPTPVRGPWTDVLTGTDGSATRLAITADARRNGLKGLSVTVDTTGVVTRGTFLTRNVPRPSCVEARVAIRPRARPAADAGITVLTITERPTNLSVGLVLTSNGLQLVESRLDGADAPLGDVPAPEGTWVEVTLRLEDSRVTWRANGVDVPLAPLALVHGPPDEVRLGTVFARSSSAGAFDLDDVELR